MRPRFVGRVGLADGVTAANAAVGFAAIAAALVGRVDLVARLILPAAVGDGLDGLLARRRGSTAVGEHLDAIADAVSFAAAPAALVVLVGRGPVTGTAGWLAVSALGGLFVAVLVSLLAIDHLKSKED